MVVIVHAVAAHAANMTDFSANISNVSLSETNQAYWWDMESNVLSGSRQILEFKLRLFFFSLRAQDTP
jgi:hypothetical protein